ncbi:hypothetical protein ACOI1H_14850 [Loktanella sp. DJP18]|uniref:hypothetical protein n=1 Tax=Loktanella sp. DJP18 TaxID=3409788 RepID=UPI003BB51B3F
MFAARPIQTPMADQVAAVRRLHDISSTKPFVGTSIVSRMGTFASLALDAIERQTGLSGKLEDMLRCLSHAPQGPVRYGRIFGRSEQFIVFRDNSMISFASDASGARGSLGAYGSILPIVFDLDIPKQRKVSVGIGASFRVNASKRHADTLSLKYVDEAGWLNLPLPALFEHTPAPIQDLLRPMEELVQEARDLMGHVPPLLRPASRNVEDTMTGVMTKVHDEAGLWWDGSVMTYWPPCLPEPHYVPSYDDLDTLRDITKNIGDLMLWAHKDIPDGLQIHVLSSLAENYEIALQHDLPGDHTYSQTCHKYSSAIKYLADSINISATGYDLELPVGSTTELLNRNTPRARGLPILTVTLERPDVWRAFAISETYVHTLKHMLSWRDPKTAIAHLEAHRSDPHPLDCQMAMRAGEIGTVSELVSDFMPEYDTVGIPITMAGGTSADVLHRMIVDIEGDTGSAGYTKTPWCEDGQFHYSLLAGARHDPHLRRPYGYITLCGSLTSEDFDQVGGDVMGMPVTSYTLRLNIDTIVTDRRGDDGNTQAPLVAAAIQAITGMVVRMTEIAEAKREHFEMDIVVDGFDHADTQQCASTMLTDALALMRSSLATDKKRFAFVSIGLIHLAWKDGMII